MYIHHDISFQKIQITDLPLLHKWLNEPHVHEWYDNDKPSTFEEIAKRYSPKILGEKPIDCYLVLYKDKPIGYIQAYKVNDYWPEFGRYVTYDDKTACVDLFIGEGFFIGKGFGNTMLRKFLKEVVFINGNITTCIICPDPANKRAIKAYEKSGFRYVKTVQIPTEPTPLYVMEIKKEDLN